MNKATEFPNHLFERLSLREVNLTANEVLSARTLSIGTRALEVLCLGTAAPLHPHRGAEELGPPFSKPIDAFKKQLLALEQLLDRPLGQGFQVLLRCFTNADGSLIGKQAQVNKAIAAAMEVTAYLQTQKAAGLAPYPENTWPNWFLAFEPLDISTAIFLEAPYKIIPEEPERLPAHERLFSLADELERRAEAAGRVGNDIREVWNKAFNWVRFQDDVSDWLRRRPARAACVLCDQTLREFLVDEELFNAVFPDGLPSDDVAKLIPLYTSFERSWGIENLIPHADRALERMRLRQQALNRQLDQAVPLAVLATHYADWPSARRIIDASWANDPIVTASQVYYASHAAKWKVSDALHEKLNGLKPRENITALLGISMVAAAEVADSLIGHLLTVDDVFELVSWWSEHFDDEDDVSRFARAVAEVLEELLKRTKGVTLFADDSTGRSEIRFTAEIDAFPALILRFVQAYALGAGGVVAAAVESFLQRSLIPSARAIEAKGSTIEPVARLLSKALGELMTVPVKDDPSDPKKRWPHPVDPWGDEDGRTLIFAIGELATSHSTTVLERVAKHKKGEAPALAAAAKKANEYVHQRRKLATPRERIDNVAAALHYINRTRRGLTPAAREQAIVEHMTR